MHANTDTQAFRHTNIRVPTSEHGQTDAHGPSAHHARKSEELGGEGMKG